MNYVVSRRARADLIDIQDYIARDSPTAVERVVDDILMAFEKLAGAAANGTPSAGSD